MFQIYEINFIKSNLVKTFQQYQECSQIPI
jgi:hypothetical protein